MRLLSTSALRLMAIGSVAIGSVAIGVSPLVPTATAGATAPAVRFAAPAGSGVACTQHQPCPLTTAINSAPADAVIEVEAGTYFAPASPTTITLHSINHPVTILGVGGMGTGAPVIYSAADPAILLGSGDVLDNVSVVDSTSYADALGTNGGSTIFDSSFRAAGIPCDLVDTNTVRDTLCLSANSSGSPAVLARFQTEGTDTMRGVTAIQDHKGSALDIASSMDEVNGTVVATNSVFNGTVDPDVDVEPSDDQTITLTLSHCDFATKALDVDNGAIDYTATHTVWARPMFAGPGRFEEASGSPTIDAGASDPASDRTDLDGNVRTIGKSPDIGAYEITQKPTVSALKVPKSTVDINKAAASVTVGAGGAATTISYRLTRAHHKAIVVKQKGGQGATAKRFTKDLAHLAAGASYTVVVGAKNARGTARSHAVHFTTKKRPSKPKK